MKLFFRSTVPAVLLAAALFACGSKHTAGGELNSLKDINVNGPGVDGSVQEIRKVLYTLKDIHEGQNYTLRTEIGLLPVGQAPDGTLTVNIYSSGAAYANDPSAPETNATPLQAQNSNIYEVNFSAQSSGDYVVVISGKSDSLPGIQFFYNLRLMSADSTVLTHFAAPTVVLATFATPTIPASDAQLINPLNPDYINIYNGGEVTPSGVYNITLVSNAATIQANPQIFVYLDSTLKVSSLMWSSIPTVTDFLITKFNAGVPDTSNAVHSSTNIISNVTFTSTSSSDTGTVVGGPFIVLKGFLGAVTYTLSIGQ